MKKIILTADDLGMNEDINDAVEIGHSKGLLTSSCIITNMDNYNNTLSRLSKNNSLSDIGIHLNLIEGKALLKQQNNPLVNKNGYFNNSFIKILINSYNKNYLKFVEKEFCAQIEKLLNDGIKPDYVNSHVHTHAIPKVFELTCRLAKKYDIKKIRTQKENFYIAPEFKRHLKLSYFINIIKNILLNFFTLLNQKNIKKYNLLTNDNFIGILYTANMDKNTILNGIKNIKDNKTTEIILHPTTDKSKEKNYIEYLTLLDESLREEFSKKDIKLIGWKEL